MRRGIGEQIDELLIIGGGGAARFAAFNAVSENLH